MAISKSPVDDRIAAHAEEILNDAKVLFCVNRPQRLAVQHAHTENDRPPVNITRSSSTIGEQRGPLLYPYRSR